VSKKGELPELSVTRDEMKGVHQKLQDRNDEREGITVDEGNG
jgi:hypothetical protein